MVTTEVNHSIELHKRQITDPAENYHAEIINLSVKDKKMIMKYPVLQIKKRFLGCVKIYTISIPPSDIKAVARAFQSNMSTALKKE